MNQEADRLGRNRSEARAHLHARMGRYANMLKEKWWVLMLCLLVGLAIQGALVYYQPPAFVSGGRMIVNIKLAIPEGSVYTEELNNFLGTQAELMKSSEVRRRAHERVMVQKSDQLLRPVSLKVVVFPKTTIFGLEATGSDPSYTQAFLQACMEEYIAMKREMRTQTSDTTVAGLTEEVMRLQKDLTRADEELAEFQKTNSVVLFEEQGNNAGNYLAALNQRLAALRSESELIQMLTLDQNLNRQQETADTPPAAGDSAEKPAASGGERSDSEYLKAKEELLLMKADQEELSHYLRPKHPKMIAMTEEITRREGLLKIYRQLGAEQMEGRKVSLALQIQNLEKEIKEWDAKMLDIQAKTAEFERLKANSQRIQALYDRLLATMQTLDVNKEISPESVTIYEKASVALPDRPDLARKLTLGGLAGLLVGVLVLAFLDRLDDRMNSFTELQELFDEDVVGQIPRERGPRSGQALPLITPDDPRHALVEAYRNLRSSLLYMSEAGQRPRTLLVTSSVPNDGKSFTSANLALTLANSGTRVLVVDADLRKGALHQRFEVPSGPGLTEVLSQGLNWESAVQPTSYKTLFVLPRGAFTAASSELFLGEATARFLKDAAAKYDYVLLDTVPVMAADDVTSLAPQVDGVLFVLRARFTSCRVARAALDSLYQRQVRVLGLIFNAVPPSSIDYYYYKYRDYYRSYPASAQSPAAGREAEQQLQARR
ncbi:MAG TPA: polysaccharide biosynthesis tyrosine autokinase [Candidatus Acidoferrum sp.]|nr:polysaccharide biosynthesis tyrosine autokinase [Candidatus Acidoferrum sp.]